MRRGLIIALGVIACLSITLATTTVWVHQVALNTDRYVKVVTNVATDPAVVEELSAKLADDVIDRFDPPRLVRPLIHDWIQGKIAAFMGSDAFLTAWAEANRAAHTALVKILRSDAVIDPDTTVNLDVLAAMGIAAQRLQEVGIIPDDVDLSGNNPAALRAAVTAAAERLGIDLPASFGQVPLLRAAQLERARQLVTIFDWVTVGAVLVAAALVALTIWLSRNRLRAAIYVGFGAAVAALLAQLAIAGIGDAVVSAIAADGAHATVGAMLSSLIGSLTMALVWVLVLGAGVAIAAAMIQRRTTDAPAETAGAEPTA
jgi:hypothetical protein